MASQDSEGKTRLERSVGMGKAGRDPGAYGPVGLDEYQACPVGGDMVLQSNFYIPLFYCESSFFTLLYSLFLSFDEFFGLSLKYFLIIVIYTFCS